MVSKGRWYSRYFYFRFYHGSFIYGKAILISIKTNPRMLKMPKDSWSTIIPSSVAIAGLMAQNKPALSAEQYRCKVYLYSCAKPYRSRLLPRHTKPLPEVQTTFRPSDYQFSMQYSCKQWNKNNCAVFQQGYCGRISRYQAGKFARHN